MSDQLANQYADSISGADWLAELDDEFGGDWIEWINSAVLDVEATQSVMFPAGGPKSFTLVTGTGGPHAELIINGTEWGRINVYWTGQATRQVYDRRLPELFDLLAGALVIMTISSSTDWWHIVQRPDSMKPGKWHIAYGDDYGTGGTLCGAGPRIEWHRPGAPISDYPWLCARCARLYRDQS